MAKKKPLVVDMCAGSELRDTQGEILSIEGADISDLQIKGRLNDNHGSGFFNSIGKVTKAKKIFKEEDCEDDRQKYYWNVVKAPYIYVAGQLYDDEDHPNARAAAAILRNIHKADCPLKIKASVEGGVVARGIKDKSLLAKTKIHSIALTFTPANQATLVEPLNLDKSNIDTEADMAIIRSVMHLAKSNIPSFRHVIRDAGAKKIEENIATIHRILEENGLETGRIYLPSKDAIIKHAIKKKVENNICKINNLTKDFVREQLNKGIKDKIAGAAMLGASSVANVGEPSPKVPTVQAEQQNPHVAMLRSIASKYPVLGAIGMKESSGGENLNHKTIDNPNSMHHGHTAGGMFGMMPHAAAFIIKKDRQLASKYPELAEAATNIKDRHTDFTSRFNSDPQAAVDFAVAIKNRNKPKTKSTEQFIYSWLNGLKGSWDALKNKGHDHIKDHWYVKDVLGHLKDSPKEEKVQKALTAGYGGAGAPTSAIGGSVLQSESLDAPTIKYITCDKCGKDQVYAKFQVKCRSCGKGLSLEKLAKLFKYI
jgi:hypothetical protein